MRAAIDKVTGELLQQCSADQKFTFKAYEVCVPAQMCFLKWPWVYIAGLCACLVDLQFADPIVLKLSNAAVPVQMCFLKGRVTEKHSSSHQMVEFSSAGKAGKGGQRAWHQRLTGSNSKPRGGRVWEEHKSPFVYSPRTSLSR